MSIAPLPLLDYLLPATFNMTYELRIPHYGMGDQPAVALGSFIRDTPILLVALDVSDNQLSDVGLTSLLSNLKRHSKLAVLNLAHNAFGQSSAQALLDFFEPPGSESKKRIYRPEFLELRLDQCRLSDRCIGKLVTKLAGGKVAPAMRILTLSRNGLDTPTAAVTSAATEEEPLAAAVALSKFVAWSDSHLQTLDVSWNNFCGDHAREFAAALASNGMLTNLNLAVNKFGDNQTMSILVESLKDNQSLLELDLSFNHMEGKASVMFAHLFESNKTIQNLKLDGNPIGKKGGKTFMRHVIDNSLLHISFEQCNWDMGKEHGHFDPHMPDDMYALQLTDDYDRAVAKQLHTLAYSQALGDTPTSWIDTKLSGKPFPIPSENEDLPTTGLLELTFKSPVPMTAHPPSDSQYEKILGLFKTHGDLDQRRAARMLLSASEVYSFTSEQAISILSKVHLGKEKADATANFVANLRDRENTHKVLGVLNEVQQKMVQRDLGAYFFFNFQNPTGHYKLDLGNRFEHLVAIILSDINKNERESQILHGKLDKSQHGDFEFFRNTSVDGDLFEYNSGWPIPNEGHFEFDYVSPVRAPEEAEAALQPDYEDWVDRYVHGSKDRRQYSRDELQDMFRTFDKDSSGSISTHELGNVLSLLGYASSIQELEELLRPVDTDGTGEIEFDEFLDFWRIFIDRTMLKDRLNIIRKHSTKIWFSSEQVRSVLYHLDTPEEQVEAFVTLFCRIVDEENMNIIFKTFSTEQKMLLHQRLGYINLFNPYHPEGRYKLDLTKYDHHFVAKLIICLTMSEHRGGTPCLHEERLNGLGWALAESWIHEVPKHGTWEFTYKCAKPNMQHRRRIAEQFLGWEFKPATTDDLANAITSMVKVG